MSFLRPAKTVERLSAGDTMNISVMELAVRGTARVLAVEPCPLIEEGPGSIVTGAFYSETIDLYKLKLEGLGQAIEVTGNHPIFSEDRGDFVPANSLRKGELLRTRSGVETVESVERKYGPWTVYNLEVNEAHRNYVTEKLVLVHNDNGVLSEQLFGLWNDVAEEAGSAIESAEWLGNQAEQFQDPELIQFYDSAIAAWQEEAATLYAHSREIFQLWNELTGGG